MIQKNTRTIIHKNGIELLLRWPDEEKDFPFGNRENIKINNYKNFIVSIGCSCTFGQWLPLNLTYSFFLERKINNEKYKVLNFGRSGLGLKPILNWAEYFIGKNCPYMYIIQPPWIGRRPFKEEDEKNLLNYVYDINNNFGSSFNKIKNYKIFIEKELNLIKNFMKGKKSIFIFFLYNYINQEGSDEYQYQNIYFEYINDIAKKTNNYCLPIIDVNYLKHKMFLCDPCHLNEQGNIHISNNIYELIRDKL